MSTLTKQLKKISTNVDNLYEIDSFQRFSLVYDDPRRVQTVECYSDSLQHFNRLCERERHFERFSSTLFAATSVQLQLTDLTSGQKKFIDKEIHDFLCLISSVLRFKDALYSLEWLIHKYRVNEFYFEDLIRSILPYYETALFSKFVQLLSKKVIPEHWKWLFAYENRPIPKNDFIKICRKNSYLLSFIASSLFEMADILKCDFNKLNDLCNLFTFTVLELLNAKRRQKEKSRIVETIQGTLNNALKRSDCPVLQSSAIILILKINEDLEINPDLVIIWIRKLFKYCSEGKEFEHLKIANKLSAKQLIVLPEKIEAKRLRLASKLNDSDAKSYQQLIEESLKNVDLENMPAMAMENCPEVLAATEVISIY